MNQPRMSREEIGLLVKKAQNGDNTALEQLIRVSQELVYSTCFRLLKNREDAQDVAQEVYIIIIKKLQLLKNREAFLSWAAIIAANKCKDLLKSRKTYF